MDSIRYSYDEVTDVFVEGHILPILAHANSATSTFWFDVYCISFPENIGTLPQDVDVEKRHVNLGFNATL
jgi:hypothetical protein